MRGVPLFLLARVVFLLVLPLTQLPFGLDSAAGFTGDVALPTLRRIASYLRACAVVGALVHRLWR